ncbi:hypothetical protein THF1C08_1110002 [Vibrio jasicida]|uniref:Uncharacterized protein n=1 Tax=Vibrio jasicida TaxID=766224 RepID=A0AAU9QFR3_9VIBR|nr:hypothetical protein THF1C08_1110002 [Vibrio jasicida]CAH1572149.1 hypothetical protein THF1A12_1140002 [Vibrio jasicida]
MMKKTLPEFNEAQLLAIDSNAISESNQSTKTEDRCGGATLRWNVSDIKQIKKQMDAETR